MSHFHPAAAAATRLFFSPDAAASHLTALLGVTQTHGDAHADSRAQIAQWGAYLPDSTRLLPTLLAAGDLSGAAIEPVRQLLALGIDVNLLYPHAIGERSLTALAAAVLKPPVNLELLDCYWQHGLEVDSVVPWMGSALSWAAQRGDTPTVQWLLAHGADPQQAVHPDHFGLGDVRARLKAVQKEKATRGFTPTLPWVINSISH